VTLVNEQFALAEEGAAASPAGFRELVHRLRETVERYAQDNTSTAETAPGLGESLEAWKKTRDAAREGVAIAVPQLADPIRDIYSAAGTFTALANSIRLSI